MFTQAQRDALAAAIASGRLTVEADGKRLTYQTTSDMRRALAIIDAELAGETMGGRRISTVFATFAND